VTYPANGFAQALRAVAGRWPRKSARGCSGCRRAGTTRMPLRAAPTER
jgi:hypothetical protein